MPFLLDTNTCIHYLRQKNSAVLKQFRLHSPSDLRLCSIVVAELYYGAYKGQFQATNLQLLGKFLPLIQSLPLDDSAAVIYGQVRAKLASSGQIIGPNDLLIASIALANGCTLVTHNQREFTRVPGLQIVDWE
jgi:tRNA(fMet)-specific endonuclease VapC